MIVLLFLRRKTRPLILIISIRRKKKKTAGPAYEYGTHDELMALGGRYAHMNSISD